MAESSSVTIFNSPILSTGILCKVGFAKLLDALAFLKSYALIIIAVVGLCTAVCLVDGPHQSMLELGKEIGLFVAWWVLLGVASSIGLGTGLHTFMLYLGPYIAAVTLVAYECNHIPEIQPSRWNYQVFGECDDPKPDDVSFWTIVWAVQLESFLWGIGTAMGELPPYFIARAARAQGKKSEELDEMEHEQSHWIIQKAKGWVTKAIVKNGFLTVLLCASIPNPLFDLAGLLCGHFGISFWTFFGAAVIGKAFIKVHIQMIFTIFLFAKHHVESLLVFVEGVLPMLKGQLSQMLEKQKLKLHSPSDTDDKTIIGSLWELFIIVMIAFFVISILNSIVRNYLEEQEQAENPPKNGQKGQNKKTQKPKKD